MTENKRIALNIVATYGRSVFGVLCGIFSTRWVLEALGQIDFGLYGLVGSMVVFVSFFNIQFSSAIARYYAYAIGEAKVAADSSQALEECRFWFSIAVLVHVVLPVFLLLIGYPLGAHAMNCGWIDVPQERIRDCIWLWRFVCASCFVGMLNVPFQAMYTAKQYISELTVYSFIQTVLRTAFIYYMVTHPRNWLVGYGLGILLLTTVPELMICVRACLVFPECRIRLVAMRQLWRILRLGGYAFWQGVGGLGYLASHQGMCVLVNNAFGPGFTGSFSVAQTVAGEAASLTGALQGAFAPAITSAYGENNMPRMRNLAFNACRYGTALTLLFAVPMALEIDYLLRIWLKNPPPDSAEMCLSVLAFIAIEKLSTGHLTAVNASGRIARFQFCRGLLRMAVIPIALAFYLMDFGLMATMSALPISAGLVVLGDVWMARTLVGMKGSQWVSKVLSPLLCVLGITLLVGVLPRLTMQESFVRFASSTVLSVLTMAGISWKVILQEHERVLLRRFCKRIVVHLNGI